MPPTRPNNFIQSSNAEQVAEVPADPVRTLGYIFLALSITLSIGSYAVLTYIESSNRKTEMAIKDIESSLSNIPLKEMLTFYNKIKAINTALGSHNFVSTALSTLSDAVEEKTYFKGFVFSVKDREVDILLNAVTSDQSSVVRQIDNLKSDKYAKYIRSAELKDVNKDNFGNISYNINLKAATVVHPDYMLVQDLNENRKINQVINLGNASTTSVSSSSVNTNVNSQIR